MTAERIAAFEACRAVFRPSACDERTGCWVKVGPPGCSPNDRIRVSCLACGGVITAAGRWAAHQRALTACCITSSAQIAEPVRCTVCGRADAEQCKARGHRIPDRGGMYG